MIVSNKASLIKKRAGKYNKGAALKKTNLRTGARLSLLSENASAANSTPVFWISSAVASAINAGASAIQEANNTKYSYHAKALQAKQQAKSDMMNAVEIATTKSLNLQAIEQTAAYKSLLDGAEMSRYRANAASSGVAMNYGSKYEANASQEYLHKMALVNADLNRVEEGLAFDKEQTNYLASQELRLGESEANDIMANSIKPNVLGALSGLSGLISSLPLATSLFKEL